MEITLTASQQEQLRTFLEERDPPIRLRGTRGVPPGDSFRESRLRLDDDGLALAQELGLGLSELLVGKRPALVHGLDSLKCRS